MYRSMFVETPAACRLHQALGRVEPCRPACCPFWEPGGAVLAGRCALEHLSLRRGDLARRLLDLRRELEEAPDEARTRRIWTSFRRAVDADRE